MAPHRIIHIVDDDPALRDSLAAVLASAGYACRAYASAAEFLSGDVQAAHACALVDVRMPQMDGLALLQEMAARGIELPVIVMTGFADVPLAVRAMKAGAVDFIEKPSPPKELLASVERAFAHARPHPADDRERQAALQRFERLTQRERDVLELLVVGDPNKIVAHKLGISPRTVEIHRGRLMEKAQAGSLAELVRMALAAGIARRDG
jgi:two-component system, LuxR family, response regulator FixJ